MVDWTAVSAYHNAGVLDLEHILVGSQLVELRSADRKAQAKQQAMIADSKRPSLSLSALPRSSLEPSNSCVFHAVGCSASAADQRALEERR